MKRYFKRWLVIPGILIWFFSGLCFSADTTSRETFDSNSPNIQFEERIYDFGIAGQQEEIKHDFIFKNGGGSPLQIKNLRTSCGCMAALLSEGTISSGGIGIIHVTFETEMFEGKQRKFVYVESNDPKEPKIELVIQGLIKTDIGVDPQGLLFGDVGKGRTISKKVRVFDLGKEELQLKKIEFNENYFVAKIDKFKGENSRGFEIEITLRPDIPAGSFSEIVTLHTNLLKRPRFDILVMGNILGGMRISPRALSMGSIKKGDIALNRIIISGEDKAFQILKVACDLPFVEVSVSSIDKKKEYELSAKLSGSSPSGPFTGQIDIVTDHPDEKILHIPVYGTIQK